jgi:hypothetical protein
VSFLEEFILSLAFLRKYAPIKVLSIFGTGMYSSSGLESDCDATEIAALELGLILPGSSNSDISSWKSHPVSSKLTTFIISFYSFLTAFIFIFFLVRMFIYLLRKFFDASSSALLV